MTARPLQRILYIEDETDIQAVAKLALEAVGGFEVEVCNSGAEALAHAPVFAPDLILLDVMMPGMDGPATLSALRTLPQTAHTPVIFMTAKVQKNEIEDYKKLGAIDVIPKPFDPMTLAELVREIWTRHHAGT
jgi:two-component system OmpR family response regulator